MSCHVTVARYVKPFTQIPLNHYNSLNTEKREIIKGLYCFIQRLDYIAVVAYYYSTVNDNDETPVKSCHLSFLCVYEEAVRLG